jgi:hypothetical protein
MNNLEPKSYSLAEFCETARLLLDSEDPASFVRFVLCGRYQNHQVIVDPFQNSLNEQYGFQGLRDYDSLLGICKDIPVRAPLTLFPLARREDTLNTNVHLNYSFIIPGVSYMKLNPRYIPPLNEPFSSALIPFQSTKFPTFALRNGLFII